MILRSNPTSIRDDKLDNELGSQSYIEETWEEVAVAGPTIVNYISSLITLSSTQDFPFASSTPDHKYEYIKYPNSFRTTLVQISNEMYNAFLDAHTNMDRIQLNMQQIPKDIKTILQLLTSASARLIQSMLPTSLANIERLSKQCADAANSTRNAFSSVTHFLHEVTQATIHTYGYSMNMSNHISNLSNISMLEQAQVTSNLEKIRENYETARKNLEKAQEEYYKAYYAIPTRRKVSTKGIFEVVGGALGGPVGAAIGGMVDGVVGDLLPCVFESCNSQSHSSSNNQAFENAKQVAELALQYLKEAQANYDRWYSEMGENQNKLTATILQLSQLHMENINYKIRIEILINATNQLSEIEAQWSKMTTFFIALATRVEATRETILYKFVENIKNVTLTDGVLDTADREFFVLSMFDVTNDIDGGAHLLYIMAKAYYDVSRQYIINQIAGLAALAVIQTPDERQTRMQQIVQDTLSTSAKVSRMALDRLEQYKQRNQARQNQYRLVIQQASSPQ